MRLFSNDRVRTLAGQYHTEVIERKIQTRTDTDLLIRFGMSCTYHRTVVRESEHETWRPWVLERREWVDAGRAAGSATKDFASAECDVPRDLLLAGYGAVAVQSPPSLMAA